MLSNVFVMDALITAMLKKLTIKLFVSSAGNKLFIP